MRRAVVVLTALTLVLLPCRAVRAVQTPVFRASADAVTVGISVRRGGRPVTDLRVEDFSVTDNGVPQTVGTLTYERLPVDTTVLFDVSGSVAGSVLDQLKRSVLDLRSSLRPADRLRLVVFNSRIQRLLDVEAPPSAIDRAFDGMATGGGSAVVDALVVALTSAAVPDRRHLVVLFSDGKDSSSVTTADALLTVARATTPTVSIVLATPTPLARDSAYVDLAAETGGTVVSLLPTDTLGGSLRRALDQFRSSYVLTYSPAGVPRSGAHAIAVTVNRPGLDVRARRSYVVP